MPGKIIRWGAPKQRGISGVGLAEPALWSMLSELRVTRVVGNGEVNSMVV